MADAQKVFGVDDVFLYVPADEVAAAKDLSAHYRLMRIYAPANWVDRTFFGGLSPCLGIMFELN